jgi:hypothetical protein
MRFDVDLQQPPAALVRWHARAHASGFLRRFTLLNRLLLAMAFLPTGMVKLLGQRFTVLPIDNPVGLFFEAMYRTGPFWHFIGAMQVIAALLLLHPLTAPLGAVVFLPICFSIVLVTYGIGFGNTVIITVLMLLSVTYLVAWDADRIWAAAAVMLRRRRGPGLLAGISPLERFGWWLGAGASLLFWFSGRFSGGLPIRVVIGAGLLGGLMVVTGWLFPDLGGRA